MLRPVSCFDIDQILMIPWSLLPSIWNANVTLRVLIEALSRVRLPVVVTMAAHYRRSLRGSFLFHLFVRSLVVRVIAVASLGHELVEWNRVWN